MPATPLLGSMMAFGGTFAPEGWAFCDGSVLPISQHAALFNLLGTRYGGDGETTFALPDLRGRVTVGAGQGPGTGTWLPDEKDGVEFVALTTGELPTHTHDVTVSGARGTLAGPDGAVLAAGVQMYAGTADTQLAQESLTPVGSGFPHDNVAPSLAVSVLIALDGPTPVQS